MNISYFVFYRGGAADPESFIQRYADTHVPILRTWPGLREVVLHTPISWVDPQPVERAGLALLTEMRFDSVADLATALTSPERKDARTDFHRFPPFDGLVYHQAMQSRSIG